MFASSPPITRAYEWGYEVCSLVAAPEILIKYTTLSVWVLRKIIYLEHFSRQRTKAARNY